MAYGNGSALSEVLQDGDTKSWFKKFQICAVVNERDDDKKLKHLPTLLRGRAWAILMASLIQAPTPTNS